MHTEVTCEMWIDHFLLQQTTCIKLTLVEFSVKQQTSYQLQARFKLLKRLWSTTVVLLINSTVCHIRN